MVATRASPSAVRHRTQPSCFYPLGPQADEDDSETTLSEFSNDVRGQAVDREPSVSTKYPAERRKEANKRMLSNTSRRRQSDPKRRSLKESTVEVREVREVHRKGGSERRNSQKQGLPREDGEVLYVYKTYKSRKGEDDRSRPAVKRRSASTGEASRTRHERSRKDSEHSKHHVEEREPQRRQSERRSPHQGERPPLRRDKRSISDTVPRSTRERAPITRSASVREQGPASILRPILQRSQTSARRPKLTSHIAPSLTRMVEKPEPTPSVVKVDKVGDRSSGIFGSIFAPIASKPSRPAKKMEPTRRVECITCLDDVREAKAVKLSCSHNMCHDCLRRIFELSVTDPQHMPPKCCTADVIPLPKVEKLFNNKFKENWNRKYLEYTTKNRIYCPARGCGTFIKPDHIHKDQSGGANHGRKFGVCKRCKTKVCCLCNNKWHTSRECPKDAATQEFVKIAKEAGWQRCFNCKATVELKEGCNHMTCRCQAEFCMVCGSKWKTCDCPWFTYEAIERDRLRHLDERYVPVFEHFDPMDGPLGRGLPIRDPARRHQEEADRRREQELADEAFARRMQALGLDEDQLPEGFGNATGHHMNADFVRQAHDILVGQYDRAHAQAAERLVNEHRDRHRDPSPPRPPRPPFRQHSTASRQYNNQPNRRASDRVVPRRTAMNYEEEAEMHRPEPPPMRRGNTVRSASALAGIARGQSGQNRVDEWRQYVDPLDPNLMNGVGT